MILLDCNAKLQTVYVNVKYIKIIQIFDVNRGYMNHPVCMHNTDSLTDIENVSVEIVMVVVLLV